MELKPGYKQTEVGLIPEDWDMVELGKVIDYTKGFAFKSVDYQSDGLRIIRISDTTFDSIKNVNQIYLDHAKAYLYDKWILKEHDLILSTVGSKPPMYDSMVGKVIIIEKQYEGALLNQNAVLLRSKKKESHKQKLLLNHFRMKRYVKYIESIFRGNANQASITLNDLFHFQLALPRKDAEQCAIADALSDVDALITSLARLIAKKRDIKQATMQQLLTGKTRLPGFSGKWKVKKVGEILRVCHGKSQNGVVVNDGKYPILATGGEIGRTNDYLYNKPSVLIGRKGTIDSPQYIDTPFWTIDTLFYTEISDRVHPRFVFYLFNMIDWFRYNEASGVPSLNASTIENIEVQCPSYLEQQDIADILTDMDAEIAALEQKRDKTRALKQGMMQELLTGKTRLI